MIFGITGDLARVMTFRSLYRLEPRGLLDCPIVGVAVDDWKLEQLIARARESIVGNRRGARRGGVRAPRRAPLVRVAETSPTRRLTSGSATPSRATSGPVFYLEIPPSLFATVIKGLAEAGLTKNARVVVEKPFGHDLASGAALAAELHQYIDESQLFRIDHYLGKMGLEEILLPAVRQHDARADVEPELRRVRPDHDGRGLRRRGSRALLRPGRRAARRRGEPPHAGGRGRRDGGAGGRRPETIKDSQVAVFRSVRTADPAHYVRGQYDGYRAIDGVAADSTTETYAALRLEIENWRWSGVPFFIRTGKRLPATQTELRLVFKTPPRLGLRRCAARRPEPDQLVIGSIPSPASASTSTRIAPTRARSAPISST